MLIFMKALSFFSLVLIFLSNEGFGDEILGSRTWTSSDGNKVEAELLSAVDNVVTIRRESDGRDFKLAFDRLSKGDQNLIASTKANLLKGVEVWKTSDVQDFRKISNDDRAKRGLVTKPSSFELARRLGILDQVASIVSESSPFFKPDTLSLPLDSLVLGGGGGSLGKTGNKTYLFRSGQLFVRLNSARNMKQKRNTIVSSGGRVIATVGSAVSVTLPRKSGNLQVTGIGKERISTKEAVVVTLKYSY